MALVKKIIRLYENYELKKNIPDKKLRNNFLDLKELEKKDYIVFFIPQCLRSNYCKAEKNNGAIKCISCHQLREDGEECIAGLVKDYLKDIFQEHPSKNIGIYIVNGGSAIPKILVEDSKQYGKPEKIVGIACPLEINQTKQLLKYLDVEIKVIPLIKDGCSETKFDQKEYDKIFQSLFQ